MREYKPISRACPELRWQAIIKNNVMLKLNNQTKRIWDRMNITFQILGRQPPQIRICFAFECTHSPIVLYVRTSNGYCIFVVDCKVGEFQLRLTNYPPHPLLKEQKLKLNLLAQFECCQQSPTILYFLNFD